MAVAGGLLKQEYRRLLRLARVQAELSRSLELRVAAAGRELEEIERARIGIIGAIERAGPAGLMFYAVAMRRLSDLDDRKAKKDEALGDMRRQLIDVRARQEILGRRAASVHARDERRQFENDVHEAAASPKATGKKAMLE